MAGRDWLVFVVVVGTIVSFPFVVLWLAKVFGYGFAAGMHKFEQRRRKNGS